MIFFLGHLSDLILISASVPPRGTQKVPVILPKVQTAGYSQAQMHPKYVASNKVTP